MFSTPGLDAGLLVRRQDKLVFLKLFPLPGSFIEIKNMARFFSKIRVAPKNPATVLPRSNCILMQPAPYGDSPYVGHQTGLTHLSRQVFRAPTGKPYTKLRRQPTRQRLYLNDYLWGEKPVDDPGEEVRPGLQVPFQKTSYAKAKRLCVGYRDGGRSHRSPGLPQLKTLSLPSEPANTVTYIFGIGWRVQRLHLETTL